MTHRILQVSILFVLAIFLFAGGYLIGQSDLAPVTLFGAEKDTPQSAGEAFRPFWETWEYLQDSYFEQPLDNFALAEGAIEGMLATLDDPNTRYLSPEQEQAARQSFQGNIEGIGAEVSSEDGAIVIVSPFEGSPAAAAGLLPGDIIREAGGTALTGMDVGEAAAIVRGPAGTTVELLIERDGRFIEFSVVRGVIDIPSVRSEILDNKIAYVRLSRFARDSADELEKELEDLLLSDPIGLILDLRSNPGGSLSTAVDVADQFLDSGVILTERFGNGVETVYRSEKDGSAQDLPVVVLIDQGSASASEVLAGAIRDRGRGLLIGTTSFGKGTVQTWKPLSNGGGVRITIAQWITPDGKWVNGEGLEPDLAVQLPEPDNGEFIDSQLQTAIDYLLGRPVSDSHSGNEG